MRFIILILTSFFLVYYNIHDNFKTEAMLKMIPLVAVAMKKKTQITVSKV